MNQSFDIKNILQNFIIEGECIKVEPYGCGHINDSFVADFRKVDGQINRYIIQRINHNIFKSPEKLMENIESVTNHLRQKIIAAGGNPHRETLNIISTIDGKSFYQSPEGNYWRGYIFIEGAKTYQVVENLEHFYYSGKAIGQFQKLLSDFPAENLYETIPNFHHTSKRFEALMEAVDKDVMNRAREVQAEIEFAMKRADDTGILVDLLSKGELPLRVTHNDTKFNNIMIDNQTGESICIIDLDTVMPGSSLYDFGDSIRFGANPAEEDEKDLSKVRMELKLYEQFTKGFLDAARDFLTPKEIEYLPFSAKLITLECGIRFLTDYLNGDVYFKIHREGHNIDRTRTQFKLVADMEEKMERMKAIVEQYQ